MIYSFLICSDCRFSCSSAGVFQCRYTGLVFKTDTAAEVQYHTASWDYGQLECEGLMAAGPLFKMKGLQGTVSQLGFPHCEIISSEWLFQSYFPLARHLVFANLFTFAYFATCKMTFSLFLQVIRLHH